MKHTEKVLRVFQHDGCGGMGYLGTYLKQQGIPYEIIHINQGEPIPASLQNVAGLIFLGSSHSTNDNYSWIEDEIALIRRANQEAVPVLGICFGGQLISKALGGNVEQAPNMQIGWYRLDATPEAVKLIGPQLPLSLEVFEWHNDTFSMPPGAIPLFYGNCIKNQGFVLGRIAETFRNHNAASSYLGVLLIGIVFALAFCPYSAVLYFGMLIPLTLTSPQGLWLPPIYALATGLPVIVFAWVIAYAIGSVGQLYNRIRSFERWFRRVSATLFVFTGIYLVVSIWF